MTENEQKQQLSVAYVHAIAAGAGYACQVKTPDLESVDVEISAQGRVHDQSVIQSPRLELQLKATSTHELKGDRLAFPLPRKNFDDLRQDTLVPRLLVVLVLPRDSSEWLASDEEAIIMRRCAYWISLQGEPDRSNRARVTVHLPRAQRFDVAQLRWIMERVSCQEAL